MHLTQSCFSVYFYSLPSLLRLTHLVLTKMLPCKEEFVNKETEAWSDFLDSTCPSPTLPLSRLQPLYLTKKTEIQRMNGLNAFPSLSADPGQNSLFAVKRSLCQLRALDITFISQTKNPKPRKDNDMVKANLQTLAKDLEMFQNTLCLGALGAHRPEFLMDSLRACYAQDTVPALKELRPRGRSPQGRSPEWQVLPHGEAWDGKENVGKTALPTLGGSRLASSRS